MDSILHFAVTSLGKTSPKQFRAAISLCTYLSTTINSNALATYIMYIIIYVNVSTQSYIYIHKYVLHRLTSIAK